MTYTEEQVRNAELPGIDLLVTREQRQLLRDGYNDPAYWFARNLREAVHTLINNMLASAEATLDKRKAAEIVSLLERNGYTVIKT